MEFSVTNSEITADELTLTVKNTLGTVTLGAAGANASGQLNFSTLMYAKGGTMLYSVTATPNEDYMQSNHAVSYTHLDVYKRQSIHRARMCLRFSNV